MNKLATFCLALAFAAGTAQAQDQSVDYTADYQRNALEIYRHIISIRSAAGHARVPEVANFLAKRFRAGGFDARDVHVLPQVLSTGEKAAALVVRYRGDNTSGKKPILLIAHMDIVDALPQDWERDPFTLVEENGNFYGRGSLDNKFGVATLTTSFLRLKKSGFTPTRDLVIAFTGDEETGMETTRALATVHRNLTDAAYVLNADGGGGMLDHDGKAIAYFVQAAEKTSATFDLTIRNPGGHSSTPRPDNAIYELAAALKTIEALEFPAQINAVTRGFLLQMSNLMPPEIGAAMRRYAQDPTDREADKALRGVPGVGNILRTTCVATMLQAGHAENALAQSATAAVNCRIFPGTAPEQVAAALAGAANNPRMEIKLRAETRDSPVSALNEEVTTAIANAVRQFYPGLLVIPSMAAYATDGREMRRAGLPTYGVMGLFIRVNDIFAHGLNERVPVRSFYQALEYWHSILLELGGS